MSNTPEPSGPPAPAPGPTAAVMRVVLVYALFAALWILGSDGLLGLLVSDPLLMAQVGMVKGWAFVVATSVLLYAMLRRMVGRPDRSGPARAPVAPGMRAPLVFVSLTVGALTVAALAANYRQLREHQASHIEAVAMLRATQIEQWMRERHGQRATDPAPAACWPTCTGAPTRAARRQTEAGAEPAPAGLRPGASARRATFLVDARGQAHWMREPGALEPSVAAAVRRCAGRRTRC